MIFKRQPKSFFPKIFESKQSLVVGKLRQEMLENHRQALNLIQETTELSSLLSAKVQTLRLVEKEIHHHHTKEIIKKNPVIQLKEEGSSILWKTEDTEWSSLFDFSKITEEVDQLKKEITVLAEENEKLKGENDPKSKDPDYFWTAPKTLPGGFSMNYDKLAEKLRTEYGFGGGGGGVSNVWLDEASNSLYVYNPSKNKWYGPQQTVSFGADSTDGSFLEIHGVTSGLAGYLIPEDSELIGVSILSDSSAANNNTKTFYVRSQATVYYQANLTPTSATAGAHSDMTIEVDIPADTILQISSEQNGTPSKNVVATLFLAKVKDSIPTN
jgi:hypothetical protein